MLVSAANVSKPKEATKSEELRVKCVSVHLIIFGNTAFNYPR